MYLLSVTYNKSLISVKKLSYICYRYNNESLISVTDIINSLLSITDIM